MTVRPPVRLLGRLLPAGLLGVGAAVLVSCGSSGKGLIPSANAGPLKSDFEAVAQAAQAGNGNCAATEEALRTTARDFVALPSTVDPGLRRTLTVGIANLRRQALALCAEPLSLGTSSTGASTTGPATTGTNTQSTTTTTNTTQTTPPVNTQTTQTTSTTPTSTTTAPSGTGGGVAAPGGSGSEGTPGEAGNQGAGHGNGNGNGSGNGNGGAGAGGAGQGGGQ